MATAMMDQYFEIKRQYPDHILFYRLGDFYEMFFDDAKTVSRELDLTLTGRDWGEEERAPMCGVPYHSCEPYISKLIQKGYKVAVCEQMGDPGAAKGPMERKIVRVITPGTVTSGESLAEDKNNYLATICYEPISGECAVAFCDITSDTMTSTSFTVDDESRILNELAAYRPSEVIMNTDESALPRTVTYIEERLGAMLSKREEFRFDRAESEKRVARNFGPDGSVGCTEEIIRAAGALLSYAEDTQLTDVSYIKTLRIYSGAQYLDIDMNTRRSLELTETMRSKEKRGTLLWVLDKTKSSLGARMLRGWIEHPIANAQSISARQDAVEEMANNFILREECSRLLSSVLDLERLTTKVGLGTANGRDLRAILTTLDVVPELRALLSEATSAELRSIYNDLDELSDIRELIRASIAEDAPFTIREGGIIADGYDGDIDYLRSVKRDGKGWVEEIEAREREATGIRTLKVGYNKVFGYYIEVSKSFASQVPDTYIRKQTLVNGERYITDELKDREATILGAEDKLRGLEYDLFCKIRAGVGAATPRLRNAAALLARLDVYCALADAAKQYGYVRPEVDYSDVIEIKDGRHPVVEQFVKDKYFVPNDTMLDTDKNRLMVITGPNMAGKSTYMRQVALIVIMAQIGSFVPAAEARIGIVDKLFTRVGASDDLSSGQSTFMLEMSEVSYILENATRKSLIIYDEIGRGTSTFDGLAIARAVAEYTHGKRIGARTMFATHYHELCELEDTLDGAVNYNIACKKRAGEITFLRKIVRGGTDDSYGIEVAKLAGLPKEVISRARDVLRDVESGAREPAVPKAAETSEISMFSSCEHDAAERLRAADINTMTPIEAMNLIFELKRTLDAK